MTQSTRRPTRRSNLVTICVALGTIFVIVSAVLILLAARGSNQGFGGVPYEIPAPYNVTAPGYVVQEPYVAPTTGGPHPPSPTVAPKVTPTVKK